MCEIFGCLKNENEFTQATLNAYEYLQPGGKLLMINWLQNEYKGKPFDFNGAFSCRLNEAVYEQSLLQAADSKLRNWREHTN
jgi:hypothetical protein